MFSMCVCVFLITGLSHGLKQQIFTLFTTAARQKLKPRNVPKNIPSYEMKPCQQVGWVGDSKAHQFTVNKNIKRAYHPNFKKKTILLVTY